MEELKKLNANLSARNVELVKKLNTTKTERDNFEQLFIDWKKINEDSSELLNLLQKDKQKCEHENMLLKQDINVLKKQISNGKYNNNSNNNINTLQNNNANKKLSIITVKNKNEFDHQKQQNELQKRKQNPINDEMSIFFHSFERNANIPNEMNILLDRIENDLKFVFDDTFLNQPTRTQKIYNLCVSLHQSFIEYKLSFLLPICKQKLIELDSMFLQLIQWFNRFQKYQSIPEILKYKQQINKLTDNVDTIINNIESICSVILYIVTRTTQLFLQFHKNTKLLIFWIGLFPKNELKFSQLSWLDFVCSIRQNKSLSKFKTFVMEDMITILTNNYEVLTIQEFLKYVLEYGSVGGWLNDMFAFITTTLENSHQQNTMYFNSESLPALTNCIEKMMKIAIKSEVNKQIENSLSNNHLFSDDDMKKQQKQYDSVKIMAEENTLLKRDILELQQRLMKHELKLNRQTNDNTVNSVVDSTHDLSQLKFIPLSNINDSCDEFGDQCCDDELITPFDLLDDILLEIKKEYIYESELKAELSTLLNEMDLIGDGTLVLADFASAIMNVVNNYYDIMDDVELLFETLQNKQDDMGGIKIDTIVDAIVNNKNDEAAENIKQQIMIGLKLNEKYKNINDNLLHDNDNNNKDNNKDMPILYLKPKETNQMPCKPMYRVISEVNKITSQENHFEPEPVKRDTTSSACASSSTLFTYFGINICDKDCYCNKGN